jgi:hypothetical protein
VVKNIKVGGGLLKRDPQGGAFPSVIFIGLDSPHEYKFDEYHQQKQE